LKSSRRPRGGKLSAIETAKRFWEPLSGLVALGVIAKVTLDIQPTYMVRQYGMKTCRS